VSDGTIVIAGGVIELDELLGDGIGGALDSDGYEMLRYGWTCGVLGGSPLYGLPGDDERCANAHDLYFGRADGWAA
jgi:hypothetical protein